MPWWKRDFLGRSLVLMLCSYHQLANAGDDAESRYVVIVDGSADSYLLVHNAAGQFLL